MYFRDIQLIFVVVTCDTIRRYFIISMSCKTNENEEYYPQMRLKRLSRFSIQIENEFSHCKPSHALELPKNIFSSNMIHTSLLKFIIGSDEGPEGSN